jgi:transcriptional regulator with XRE-family HTH domain
MSQSLNNYIRRARKRLGLSQRELSLLIGKKGHSLVSRFEKGRKIPTLEMAMTLSVVLRTPIEELFAGRFEKVEATVVERAAKLTPSNNSEALARVITTLQEPSHEE